MLSGDEGVERGLLGGGTAEDQRDAVELRLLGTAPMSSAGRARGGWEPARVTRAELSMGAVMRADSAGAVWAAAGRGVARRAAKQRATLRMGLSGFSRECDELLDVLVLKEVMDGPGS